MPQERQMKSIFSLRKRWMIIFVLLFSMSLFFTVKNNWSDRGVIQIHRPDISLQEFRSLSLLEQSKVLEATAKQVSVLALIEFVKEAYPEQHPSKHNLSHTLGEIAFEQRSFKGFGACDSFLAFGCFHGVALAAIRTNGLDSTLSDALWEGCESESPYPDNCLHGLGHAIMVINQYDVLKAFKECERIFPDENRSFWCQDGVAMENTFRSVVSNDDGDTYENLDDPYYPCNLMPERYQAVCVKNHVGVLIRNFSFNFQEVTDFCHSFSLKETKENCILELGSIIAGMAFENTEFIVDACRKTQPYTLSCILGGVTALSMARHYENAGQLCDSLGKVGERIECFNRIKSFERVKNF